MKRVLTAFLLVPIGVYSALFAPGWIFVPVVVVFAFLCFREYADMTGSSAPLGFAAGVVILIVPPDKTIPIVFLSVLACMCLPLAAPGPEKAVVRSGTLLLG